MKMVALLHWYFLVRKGYTLALRMLVSSAVILFAVLFFQNCQKARMSEASSLGSTGSLTQVNEEDFDLPPPAPVPGPLPGPAPNPGPAPDPSPSPSPTPSPSHNPGGCNDQHEYICDIYQPGNAYSMALGISGGELEIQHTGTKLLCMSKSACEVTAGAAFPGAKAEPRGFCSVRNNKNVTHVTDSLMQQLVDKWIQEHP